MPLFPTSLCRASAKLIRPAFVAAYGAYPAGPISPKPEETNRIFHPFAIAGEKQPGAEDRPEQGHVDVFSYFLRGKRFQCFHVKNAGVVDEKIDGSESFPDFFGQCRHRHDPAANRRSGAKEDRRKAAAATLPWHHACGHATVFPLSRHSTTVADFNAAGIHRFFIYVIGCRCLCHPRRKPMTALENKSTSGMTLRDGAGPPGPTTKGLGGGPDRRG